MRENFSSYIINECKRLRLCGARLFFPFHSVFKTPVPCLEIGSGKMCSILVGAHHGMEYITAIVLVKFASELLSDKEITSKRTVFILPMLNPDGCDIAIGDIDEKSPLFGRIIGAKRADLPFWQANANGIDLNHNYNAGFEKCKALERELGIFSPCRSRYGGTYPESEPETRGICELSRHLKKRLRTAVALHTQGEEIYFDYNGKTPQHARELAERLSSSSGYALSVPERAASHGGYKDYIIEAFNIPAFTIECGRGKNPLPQSDIDDIFKKISPMLKIATSF